MTMGSWTPPGSHLPNPSDRLPNRDATALRLVVRLGRGRAAIRGGHELAASLGIGQRSLGGVVHRARELGWAVGSAHGLGYYLIETQEELNETVAHIERRARGLAETARLLTRAFEQSA